MQYYGLQMLGIWYLQQLFLSFLYPFFQNFSKPHIASSILMHWFLAHESNNACVKKLLLVKKPVKHKNSGSHKHWFLIHDAMQLLLCREEGFLCLCTMQYKWPLFPIQPEVFLRFSLHLQRDICVLNSGYANQTWKLKTLVYISALCWSSAIN